MSSDIAWSVMRKTSCFRRTRKDIRTVFSAEPLNVRGVHSQRYSGLAARRAVGVAAAKDNKGVVVTTKTKHAKRKPVSGASSVTLKKHARATLAAVDKAVQGYAPRMKMAALRKASLILRSQKPSAGAKRRRAAKTA